MAKPRLRTGDGARSHDPGFKDGISVAKSSEEFTIDVTSRKSTTQKNLKGKAAKFAINLKKVERANCLELTGRGLYCNVLAWKMVPSLACASA